MLIKRAKDTDSGRAIMIDRDYTFFGEARAIGRAHGVVAFLRSGVFHKSWRMIERHQTQGMEHELQSQTMICQKTLVGAQQYGFKGT